MKRKYALPVNIYWRRGKQKKECVYVRLYLVDKKHKDSPRMFYFEDFPTRQDAIDAAIACRDKMKQTYQADLAVNNPSKYSPKRFEWRPEEDEKLCQLAKNKATPVLFLTTFADRPVNSVPNRLKRLGFTSFAISARLISAVRQHKHQHTMLLHQRMVSEKMGVTIWPHDIDIPRERMATAGQSLANVQRRWLWDLAQKSMPIRKNASNAVEN